MNNSVEEFLAQTQRGLEPQSGPRARNPDSRDSERDVRDRERERDRDFRDRDRERDRERDRYRTQRWRRRDDSVDRERERERHRDRDRDYRDRGDRGDRGGGGRDRYSRDRRDRRDDDRSSRDRPRDRDRDRDRGDRDRTRERTRDRDRDRDRELSTDDTVVPLDERPLSAPTGWDVKARGYERVSSELAKRSGLFPLPGRPTQVNYNVLRGLVEGLPDQPTDHETAAMMPLVDTGPINNGKGSVRPEFSRVARRLILSGIPAEQIDTAAIKGFFTDFIEGLELQGSKERIVDGVYKHPRLPEVLVEFFSAEMATLALALSGLGINYHGPPISIRRPSNYICPTPERAEFSKRSLDDEKEVASVVEDSSTKIIVWDLPFNLDEDQVRQLAASYGELSAFQLIRQLPSRESAGIALLDYKDPEVVKDAVSGLLGQVVGGKNLKVMLACEGPTQLSCSPNNGLKGIVKVMNDVKSRPESSVIVLFNLVTLDELLDDVAYREITEQVESECLKYGGGEEIQIKIPRPDPEAMKASYRRLIFETRPGVGKVYVKFANVNTSRVAMQKLTGLRFSRRSVIASYYSEECFDMNVF
ncbi:Splicing factor U2AF 59 kDa subunit [Yarrowia sp. C11]|nr:Splicing factor U2AF 59 kDa subunit [Yarrowia sp. E02]KAG5371759.1 Splicing factor U2AF 59 kDa subunit [Yarrowia sp. C11]